MRQIFLLAAIFLSGCSGEPAVESVTDARIQLPIVTGRPGVAYFTLNGGATENRLMQISSPQIIRTELHESKMKDGMMTMTPLEGGVAVPAGGKVAFAPGGKHAMLFDINPALKVGGKVKLVFTYVSGRSIEVDAEVKAAGSDKGHDH